MKLKKIPMKTVVAVLFCLVVVGTIVDICEGNEGTYAVVGPIAGACIIAFAIMDHTDRVLGAQRKGHSEENTEKE